MLYPIELWVQETWRNKKRFKMAEAKGFEPLVPLLVRMLSKHVP